MVNPVPIVRPVLVAWHGNADGNQYLWKVYSAWGAQAKAPLQAILVTSPLELLHVDFTDIEMLMELDQPSHVVNVLVFCDHFTGHGMAYVTPSQMIKTVAKFLWQWYISIFRALAKLLSDREANFESNIISQLCELMGIQKARALPYHPQTNGQVERATKCWCWWLENWVKIRRQTGLSIYQNWCMLTIPQDQPSLDTAHTIWCLGDDHT